MNGQKPLRPGQSPVNHDPALEEFEKNPPGLGPVNPKKEDKADRLPLSRAGRLISSRIGQAIGDYNLIAEGDRILVAVSGGKDSLSLLKLLKARQAWSPVYYELTAAHIETDVSRGGDVLAGAIRDRCAAMSVPYVLKTITLADPGRPVNCFWCSWNKRKALFEIAAEAGCNKIAFGHHKDDIIETILLNLFYKGEISAMQPRQEIFQGKLVLIRPLCYVEEAMTRRYARENGFGLDGCRCPVGGETRRQRMKECIHQLQKETPGTNIRSNIFNSVARINAHYIHLKEDTGALPGEE